MDCKIITIFSSKGGVGKTFATVNLAAAMSLTGKKVLLIDLDFQASQDMARMLNLSPRNCIADVIGQLEGNDDPNAVKSFVTTHSCGIDFLPAIKNAQQISLVTPDNIKLFFKKAITAYDYIFVDAGKSFSENLIAVLDYSNLILLIATPDILAVYQIKWCLEVLQNLQYPLKMVKLILNRSESRGSVAWQEVRSALPCEIFSHIPSDGKTVGIALNQGIPCVVDSPRSKVTEAFVKTISMLIKEAIFVKPADTETLRTTEGLEQPDKFWQKFGVTTGVPSGPGPDAGYTTEESEIFALKQKIHEKLVERLNLDGITIDTLSDPSAALKVKKSSEEIVGNLLLEESGGTIGSHDERTRLVKDIVNEALGLGPLEEFLADPEVTDIMANNKDTIYVEKSGKLVFTNRKFISNDKMRAIIDRIIAPLGRRIDESTPMVDARLPDGSRVNAIIPPLSLNGPMITIRKFAHEKLESTDLLEKYKSLTVDMRDFIKACVLTRKNIIVSGGTGAGKTTLLNVISEFIPDEERILTIEDAAELRLKKSHWGRLETRPPNVEGRGAVTIRDLFVNSLRMRPDRILIGECRGGEVLDMLQAMNTGHDGSMTTLHANSTRDAITRLHSLILLSGVELPVRAINEMISSAIQIVVHVNRMSDGTRKITGITETLGLDKEFQLELADVFVYKQAGIGEGGVVLGDYQTTGYIPKCYDDFITRGLQMDKNIFNKKDS